MVLGSGLLAKAFTNFNNDNSVIVFASGVSNSLQSEEGEYQREFTLLKTFSFSSSLFIYFSTCSVFDHTLEKSPYILHKLKTEKFIRENFTSFIIFICKGVFKFFYENFVQCSDICQCIIHCENP